MQPAPNTRLGDFVIVREIGRGGMGVVCELLVRAGASRLNRCEAHSHISMRHLARGGRVRARHHFEQVINTRVFLYLKYMWASSFLARVKAGRKWPPWVPQKK